MAMDQEVDVRLFITCRLCLDEPGAYQIVPSIKEQINYCFGIDVDPFDGLPQLICKKCKSILTEYYETKNLFVGKQSKLRKNLSKDIKGVELSPSLAPPKTESLPEESPAANDVPPPTDPEPPAAPVTDTVSQKNRKRCRSSWKKAYSKHFVCTICDKSFLTEKSIRKHWPTHKKTINNHQKIFKNYVTVSLNKIDKKKNSTGGLQNVVYNKNKVIERSKSQYYYSFYKKKDSQPDDETDENENVPAKRPRLSSDSSDGEVIKGKKRRTGRLESTSSTQTVILEVSKDVTSSKMDNHSNTNETEYINLDDTSSDCPKNNVVLDKKRKMPQRRQLKAEVGDYKAIQNIVTMCHKNYIKKGQADTDGFNKSTFSESSLKHKVLSLGRKVLNSQGFVCTGLFRYVEHKDLDIIWTPTTNDMKKKGSNFVRLMSKLKSREDSENDDACWKNLHDISFCRGSGVEGEVTASDVGGNDRASPLSTQNDEDHTPSESNDSNKKLLNKTPVANPRQLPKKNNISETKLVLNADDAAVIPQNFISDALEDAPVEDDNNMCLPIITSTTSLSLNVNEKEEQEVPVTERPAPRIKVKPASELMSARALNNQESLEDIWSFNPVQSSLPLHLANATISRESPGTDSHGAFSSSQTPGTFGIAAYRENAQPVINESNHKEEHRQNLEYIILDSPQFPNTKTLTPFQYFRKILLVHGLKLLDLNEGLPEHFNCLIKFRLKLKQDTRRPIDVLLSLYCSKDTFCFSFKDTNSKKFDPNQLPAFWQWELLKIYQNNVVDKILQNAMKEGKDVYEYTKLFLSLLKSIKIIKEA